MTEPIQNTEISESRNKRPLIRLGLCCAIGLSLALGVFLRIEDLIAWREKPGMAFYKGTPLLTTFDGYFYARYARELAEGNYKPIDELRYVPQNPAREFPPPLLSLLIAGLVKLTGVSVDWVCTFFPAVFAVLLFFPVFLIGRSWGGAFVGFVAGILSLCSPYYVNRSRLGWLDTDCGNVTFTMLAVYLAMRSVTTQGPRRFLYLAGVLINFIVYLQWWDSTPYVVVVTCLGTLVVSYVCEPKSWRRSLVPFAAVASVFVAIMIYLKGAAFWVDLVPHLLGHFKYISKAAPGDFPNIGLSISEQAKIPFEGVVQISAGSWYLFLAAALGTAQLVIRSPRQGLQLLVPMGLGGLTFLYARRFGIFLAPFLGLGIAYLLLWLRDQIGTRTPRYLWKGLFISALVGLLVGGGHLVLLNTASTFWPVETPILVQGMDSARLKTPPGSLIWTWWDHGYPMQYYGRRGTVSDGAYHDGELAMINGFPYATGDYQQAANWMHFYAVRGIDGFHRVYQQLGSTAEGLRFVRHILAAGPEEGAKLIEEKGLEPKSAWLTFFFPPPSEQKRIYMFVDERLVGTSYWWYWLGTWDIGEQEGMRPVFVPFYDMKQEGNQLIGAPSFSVDLEKGMHSTRQQVVALSSVVFRDGNTWRERTYRDVGMIFEYDLVSGWGVLSSPEIHESVFNKLFFLGMADVRYFRPTTMLRGVYQLWEVHSDQVGPSQ